MRTIRENTLLMKTLNTETFHFNYIRFLMSKHGIKGIAKPINKLLKDQGLKMFINGNPEKNEELSFILTTLDEGLSSKHVMDVSNVKKAKKEPMRK